MFDREEAREENVLKPAPGANVEYDAARDAITKIKKVKQSKAHKHIYMHIISNGVCYGIMYLCVCLCV